MTSPKEIAQRVFLAFQNPPQRVVAEALGLSESTIRAWFANKSKPTISTLEKVKEQTHHRLDWLIAGEDPPHELTEHHLHGRLCIPTYDTGGGLHWVVADDATPDDTDVPPGLMGFRVHGGSMEPVALDGQVVIANPEVRPESGDLAVVELKDGMHTFKRVYFQNTLIVLHPVNPTHAPELVKRRDIRRMMRVWGVRF